MLKILIISIAFIFHASLSFAQSATEEFKILEGMLSDQNAHTRDSITRQAMSVRDNFPGTEESSKAGGIANSLLIGRSIESILNPTTIKRPTPSLANLELFYEDPITDSKFYRHKDVPNLFYALEVKLQVVNNKPKFYLSMGYSGDSWIFFEEIQAKCGEQTFVIRVPSRDAYRDTGSGGVFESIDVPLTGKPKDLAICISKNPDKKIVRLSGKYSSTTYISSDAALAIADMLYLQKNWLKTPQKK